MPGPIHPQSTHMHLQMNSNKDSEQVTKLMLACMKGCWNPEFKPSVEEIVDY